MNAKAEGFSLEQLVGQQSFQVVSQTLCLVSFPDNRCNALHVDGGWADDACSVGRLRYRTGG